MNLIERIDQWGHKAPDRLVHVSGGRTMNWRDLVAQSNALASQITQQLPSDRSPIAVMGHKEPEMLVGFLGSVKAGHPYVPIDVSIPPQRVERILAAAGAKLVLTPEKIASMAGAPAGGAGAPRPVASEDPYYIIFTSGSTGDPKGVIITLSCLETFVAWTLGEQTPREMGEVFLNQAPFSFDLSVMDLYACLATGGTLYSIVREEAASPRRLFASIAASQTSFWVSTPSFAQMCLVEKKFDSTMLPDVRKFWFCGETLPAEIAAQLIERFPQAEVWNTYGPTEATVATTSVRIDRQVLGRHNPLPVGYAMPGTRVFCVAEDKTPVADGERGEIVIAGPNVSPGYLGRPDLTERAFFVAEGQRAYRTGDWGRTREGLIFFEGRIDGQLKLHGYRIEIGDIEANLRALPDVSDAVVIPVMKDGKVDSLAAFIVPSRPPDGSEADATLALRAQLGQKLPTYMVPRKLVFVDAFPLTANGKADRRKLAERLA